MADNGNQTLGLDSRLRESLNPNGTSPPWADPLEPANETEDRPSRLTYAERHQHKSQIQTLTDLEFYKQDNFVEELCELLFKLKRRDTTVGAEVYYGVIHFISCLYVLAVVPQQMISAGYDGQNTVTAVALTTGVATIFCGLFANLPFVLAPPTVVSIFLSVFLQQNNLKPASGNIAVVVSGLILMLFGWRPLGRLASRWIPIPIQAGTAIGIGLLTALAGSTEIGLVISGHYAILKMGVITPEICIAIAGIVIIAVSIHYHVKGSFCIAVVICSVVWWIYDNDFPKSIAAVPNISHAHFETVFTSNNMLLTADLAFLYVLYLNGLMTSLSNLAALTRDDSTVPRGRWIFIMCGIFTVIAGLSSSAPILVSPESSASIKEGAKTGLSAVVCGVLFLLSCFFAPLFQETPATGTSPVLIMIGIILFQNCSRLDWRNIAKSAPAFIVLFYIPFTYSVIQGVVIGYVVYLSVTFFTGELWENTIDFLILYMPFTERYFQERLLMRRERLKSKQRPSSHVTSLSGSFMDHTQSGHGGDGGDNSTALYDDRDSMHHINHADMSMGTNDVVSQPDDHPHHHHHHDSTRPSQMYPDFGTDFSRNTAGSSYPASTLPSQRGSAATARSTADDASTTYNSFPRGSQPPSARGTTTTGSGAQV